MSNTSTRSAGEILAETILNSKRAKDQAESTIAAIRKYKKLLDERCNAGDLEEHVYDLFGGGEYVDNLFTYPEVIRNVLAALCLDPVSAPLKEKIGSAWYENLIDMLSNLLYFTQRMDPENFRAFMKIQDLGIASEAHRYPIEKLVELEEDYTKMADPKIFPLLVRAMH